MRNLLLAALVSAAAMTATAQETTGVEGLPAEASRTGTVITIDVSTNRAYLFRDGQLVRSSAAATGSDKVLRKGRRVWWFRTPRGKHQVVRKIKDPVWTKPDWAFIEEGKKVPPPDSPLRKEKGTMGKYALDLGDRVMIHGTNDPKSIGRRVSHGCIRLPNDMLSVLWKEAAVGTEVYIFESKERQIADSKGLNDLDLTEMK
ncbi:MAG TPA: L,D-transpeptidase [Thermoanaerobaculia bacterium]|nr:L,D-transpeptidase [Thermoanaerobaculia bacterium]